MTLGVISANTISKNATTPVAIVITELTVEPVIVEHTTLRKLIEKLGQSAEQNLKQLVGDDLDIDFAENETAAPADAAIGGARCP